jgi:hypothetical protein
MATVMSGLKQAGSNRMRQRWRRLISFNSSRSAFRKQALEVFQQLLVSEPVGPVPLWNYANEFTAMAGCCRA